MVCHPDANMYLPNLDGRGAVGGVAGGVPGLRLCVGSNANTGRLFVAGFPLQVCVQFTQNN